MQSNKYHSIGREYTSHELRERREAFEPKYFYRDSASFSAKSKPFQYPEGRAAARAVARRERKSANKHN